MKMFQKLKLAVASLILALVLMASVAVAAIMYRYPITGTAYVHGYEITVWESDGTTPLTEIHFGDLDQGGSAFHDIMIENTGDYNTLLGLEHDLGEVYGTLTWDLIGELMAGEMKGARITLALTPDCPRGMLTFSINITCVA